MSISSQRRSKSLIYVNLNPQNTVIALGRRKGQCEDKRRGRTGPERCKPEAKTSIYISATKRDHPQSTHIGVRCDSHRTSDRNLRKGGDDKKVNNPKASRTYRLWQWPDGEEPSSGFDAAEEDGERGRGRERGRERDSMRH